MILARITKALRNQNWRYGKWPDGEELYDLRKDPQEKSNLAHGKGHKERLEGFRRVLASKQKLFEANP